MNWGLNGVIASYGTCTGLLTLTLGVRLFFINFKKRGKIIRERIDEEKKRALTRSSEVLSF